MKDIDKVNGQILSVSQAKYVLKNIKNTHGIHQIPLENKNFDFSKGDFIPLVRNVINHNGLMDEGFVYVYCKPTIYPTIHEIKHGELHFFIKSKYTLKIQTL